MLVLLSAIVVLQVILVLSLLFFSIKIKAKIRSIEWFIGDFFEAEPGKESKFAQLVDSSASVFSARLVSSAQAALRGSAGGTMKGLAAEETAANPLLGLLRGTKLGKSPLAVGLLSLLGSKIAGSTQSMVPSSPGNGDKPKFHL